MAINGTAPGILAAEAQRLGALLVHYSTDYVFDGTKSGAYDAVICDLCMPRMDGESLYGEVTRRYPYMADRFVFVTSQATRRAGMGDFIQRTGNTLLEKPFEVEALRTAVREVLAR